MTTQRGRKGRDAHLESREGSGGVGRPSWREGGSTGGPTVVEKPSKKTYRVWESLPKHWLRL